MGSHKVLKSSLEGKTQVLFLYFFSLTQASFQLTLLNAVTGLSMNILHVGDKSPTQSIFFTNSMGDLLPALRFLGGLYNFCNFVIIFPLM